MGNGAVQKKPCDKNDIPKYLGTLLDQLLANIQI